MSNKKYKIYTLDYLINEELTEDDLFYLFDTPSLNYSFVCNMFKMAGYNLDDKAIIDIVKNDRWQDNYYWTKSICKKFEDNITEALKNIYSISQENATMKAQNWLILYGITVDDKNSKRIH